LREPGNELIHLYEIRDALSTKFGGERGVRAALLGISSSDWSMLGRLANDEPIRQGRHRGHHAGALRGATETELAQARAIARRMIDAYLRYLETGGSHALPAKKK
jgi:hypothetical protein